MTYQVSILPSAEAQLDYLDGWWRENRTVARDQVRLEIRRLVGVLEETPGSGLIVKRRRFEGLQVRRYRLHKTPYYLFYVVDEEAQSVRIVAIWSSMRRRGPPLQR